MGEIFEKLFLMVITGGESAIIAFLIIAVVGLLVERRRLLKKLDKNEEKIDKIIDDYYKGNMTLSEALNSLKLVLYEIKGKL